MAKRCGLEVILVADSWMRIPEAQHIRLEVVEEGMDAADDWIAEHVDRDDIVITADIPLANRCLKKGARVLGPTGKPFTDDNIGPALATRDLMSELRELGDVRGGPPPMQKKDRSRFLQKLDEIVQDIRRSLDPPTH